MPNAIFIYQVFTSWQEHPVDKIANSGKCLHRVVSLQSEKHCGADFESLTQNTYVCFT